MYTITNAERRLVIEMLAYAGSELKASDSTRLQNKGRLARLLVKKLEKQKKI